MRLIDAGKLRAEYLGMPNCYNGFSDTYDKAMIVDMVDEQPTIDAVPVVRCRDCKWWTKQEASLQGRCDAYGMYPTGEWYCARGERKDDAIE